MPTKDSDGEKTKNDEKTKIDDKPKGLSALQDELRNPENRIEMQKKDKQQQQRKKVDAASLYVRNDEYEKRRNDSKLYASLELHVTLLTLLLDLMTTDIGTLDPLYVSQVERIRLFL